MRKQKKTNKNKGDTTETIKHNLNETGNQPNKTNK